MLRDKNDVKQCPSSTHEISAYLGISQLDSIDSDSTDSEDELENVAIAKLEKLILEIQEKLEAVRAYLFEAKIRQYKNDISSISQKYEMLVEEQVDQPTYLFKTS